MIKYRECPGSGLCFQQTTLQRVHPWDISEKKQTQNGTRNKYIRPWKSSTAKSRMPSTPDIKGKFVSFGSKFLVSEWGVLLSYTVIQTENL